MLVFTAKADSVWMRMTISAGQASPADVFGAPAAATATAAHGIGEHAINECFYHFV